MVVCRVSAWIRRSRTFRRDSASLARAPTMLAQRRSENLASRGQPARGARVVALRQQGFVTALRQYPQVLAGAAIVEGVDLEGTDQPLVQ
jgi:hypothetical protein